MMSIPAIESQYVISLEEIFWGGTLVGVTMALHGLGQDQQMQLLKQKREKRHPKQAPAPSPAGKQSQ
jgi:hypothetical protein